MKILYHHRIASKDGQYVHIEELTRALRKLGHEVIIVGPAAVEEDVFGSESGAIALLKRAVPGFLYESLELGYNLVAYRRLYQAVRRHRPDCIFERCNLYMLAGVWIKRRFKLPLLLEVNAPLFDERSRFGKIALRFLARWSEHYVWRKADAVLAVTQVLAKYLRAAGVADRRIHIIPNAIDPAKFGAISDQVEAKRRLGLEGRCVLGFTGFAREWHGLERVVDVVASDLTGARHLVIVGDGPARQAIETHARTLGVASRVTVTGVVDRHRVADYVAAFDVALQPDVVPYASPLKLFEYLALGRAIVAPDSENIREVLSHEHNALLFDPQDTAAFARTIERLCSDAELRTRIGENARRTIYERGYTWDNNAREVISLFEQVGVGASQPGVLRSASEADGP
jgi:glycosyltransferase involved in cell wall biosynthesis